MKMFKGRLLLFAFLSLFFSVRSNAQYNYFFKKPFRYLRSISHYELGISNNLATGDVFGATPVYNHNMGYMGDTTIHRNINAKQGYGGFIAVAVPFARLGHLSALSLDMGIMYNTYIWNDLNETYSSDGGFHKNSTSLNAVTDQFAVPIGINYKVGTDAIASKTKHLGLTLGVGVMPQLNYTALEGLSSSVTTTEATFTALPYAKAEIAFFLGICFKLRAMYSFGDVPMIYQEKTITTLTDGPFKLTNKSNFVFSLVLMPFSYKWDEKSWWNTYDTYNSYD